MDKKKVVKLSVHKNTKEKRRRKQTRDSLLESAKAMAQLEGLDGFIMVAWDKNGDGIPAWDHGSLDPRLLTDLVIEVIEGSKTE